MQKSVMNMEDKPTQLKRILPEPWQQPTVQPPRRKMNRTIVSVILIVAVACSSLGMLGYFHWDLNNKYNRLQSSYSQLSADYQSLQENHRGLNAVYNNLNERYEDLNEQYQDLFADYDTLWHIFNEPIANKEVPTIEELQQWLSDDKTDEIQYDYSNFICGDFSVMLSQHAKLENWDMGIVLVYGYDENYKSYSHAFNAIITTEGLRYVEPQDDYFWRFSDGLPILENRWNAIGRDRTNIYVEEYIEILSF